LTTNSLNPFDPNFDYGPSDFDVRHRFIGSVNWEVPFDWFLNRCCGGSNTWAKHLLGGWQVAGIFNVQSGLPFTVFNCTGALTAETPCPRAGLATGVDLDSIRTGNGDSFPSATVPNQFNFIPGTVFSGPAVSTVVPPFPTNTPGRNFF